MAGRHRRHLAALPGRRRRPQRPRLLYLFPLAGAAILAPLVLALFSAALATLFLLAESTWQLFLRDGDPPLMQAGMTGAAFFAVVLVVSRLAARLIGQEELAARAAPTCGIQQAIYRIVVDDVGDGILVVGRDGFVFGGNPAARRMLGLESDRAEFPPGRHPRPGTGGAGLRGLAGAACHGRGGPGLGHHQALAGDGTARCAAASTSRSHLKLRFARVDTPDGAAERSVIFLQDVSAIENQAQQLKLASMGRLTASIAHEVRNPLSAIGHATSLLAEDLHGPAEPACCASSATTWRA
jgi:two-component system sensor histidine kinase PilS (NtrC family)